MEKEQESQASSLWENLDERVLLAFLAVLIIVGFFIFELFGQAFIVQVGRFVILFLVFVVIYILWSNTELVEVEETEEEDEEEKPNFDHIVESVINVNFLPSDDKVDFYQDLNQFFGNLIKMVRATFVAHSAIIFLSDKKSEKLRVEFCESQSPSLKRGDLVEINGTLPGSAFVNQTEILEQNIPEEGQPVNYYHDSKSIKSFLAVPISINSEIGGVLAVDSLVAHDFSSDDLDLLKAYEGLISQGIQLIGEREKSQLINQSLRAQRILLTEMNEDLSYDNLYSSVGSACRAVYQFDRLSIVTIDSEESEMGIISKVIGQRDIMGEGFRFSLNDGITGWVVRKNKPLILGDLEKGDLFRPRYAASDKSNFGLRSFLGVPISFRNQVFGMISLESKQPDFYSDWDQNVLMLLAANVGLAFLALRLLPQKM